jgi:hypothetical protein
MEKKDILFYYRLQQELKREVIEIAQNVSIIYKEKFNKDDFVSFELYERDSELFIEVRYIGKRSCSCCPDEERFLSFPVTYLWDSNYINKEKKKYDKMIKKAKKQQEMLQRIRKEQELMFVREFRKKHKKDKTVQN